MANRATVCSNIPPWRAAKGNVKHPGPRHALAILMPVWDTEALPCSSLHLFLAAWSASSFVADRSGVSSRGLMITVQLLFCWTCFSLFELEVAALRFIFKLAASTCWHLSCWCCRLSLRNFPEELISQWVHGGVYSKPFLINFVTQRWLVDDAVIVIKFFKIHFPPSWLWLPSTS